MQEINHEILVWARETAGLSLQEASLKLNIKDGPKGKAVEWLEALEKAQVKPNRAVLLKMSKCYRRSLLTFYLEKPPLKANRGQDFRQLPSDYSQADEVLLDVLVRNVKTRQSLVRAILEEEEPEKKPFIGCFCPYNSKIEDIVKSIKETLQIDLREYQSQTNPQQGFELLRKKAEEAGIFVLLIGDLGSHHTGISHTIFRGFADADPFAPFVVINDQDAKSAWSFTLLHELAHLWLGASGISNEGSKLKIEQLCNEVAAEILLPRAELYNLEIPSSLNVQEAKTFIAEIASKKNLSHTMVADRLCKYGLLNRTFRNELYRFYKEEWSNTKKEQKEKKRGKQAMPNNYDIHRHKLGNALINFVARTMSEGTLSTTKAAIVLDVKPRSVDSLVGTVH